MKISRLFALNLVAAILAFSSLSLAQEKCAELFQTGLVIGNGQIRADQELSQDVLRFMDVLGQGSTTSLRQESKFVVSESVVSDQLRFLDLTFQEKFKLRDNRVEGRKNVTVTQYAFPMKIQSGNKKLSAKIRFRKYYDTSDKMPLGQDNLQPVNFVKEHQFVEFKIDHPQYDQVVLKPRMVVLDSDVQLMHEKGTFEANKAAIIERTLAVPANGKTPKAVIEQFFKVFEEFYKKGSDKLPLFAQTAYVRDSYSVMLKANSGAYVEIQMTVDREIIMTDTRTSKKTSAYRSQDIVVELKIPLEYSGLTKKNFEDLPGLEQIADLKEALKQNHIQLYREGAGKLSTFRRTLKDLE